MYDFDVRKYGAKGDGGTDDAPAFQAALDAAATVGGTVYCGASKAGYLIAKGLVIPTGVRLLGDFAGGRKGFQSAGVGIESAARPSSFPVPIVAPSLPLMQSVPCRASRSITQSRRLQAHQTVTDGVYSQATQLTRVVFSTYAWLMRTTEYSYQRAATASTTCGVGA